MFLNVKTGEIVVGVSRDLVRMSRRILGIAHGLMKFSFIRRLNNRTRYLFFILNRGKISWFVELIS